MRNRDSTALSAVVVVVLVVVSFAFKTWRCWYGLVDTVKLLGAVRGALFFQTGRHSVCSRDFVMVVVSVLVFFLLDCRRCLEA